MNPKELGLVHRSFSERIDKKRKCYCHELADYI